MAKVKLARGTQNAYNAIQSKDTDTIYVCTDTGNLYLGSQVLFESNSYIDATISGKVVTFTTHGANGTNGSDTLDLSLFQTASEVTQAINSAISSVYKPAGSLAAAEIAASLLTSANEGNVYNVSEEFTTTTNFVEGAGKTYPAGTNIVVVNTGTSASPVYKFDILAGFMDLSNYVTQVQNATAGNFAGLDANGNITDSGYNASDFKKTQTAVNPAAGDSMGVPGDQYVEQVTQNTNGVITVTRKKLPKGSGNVGTTSSAADAWKTVVHDAALSGALALSGNTKSIPAATSTNDGYMTKEQAGKLDGIAAGGEVNVLEAVKISGNALTIDANKAVNIVTGTAYNESTNLIATMSDIADAALMWGSF